MSGFCGLELKKQICKSRGCTPYRAPWASSWEGQYRSSWSAERTIRDPAGVLAITGVWQNLTLAFVLKKSARKLLCVHLKTTNQVFSFVWCTLSSLREYILRKKNSFLNAKHSSRRSKRSKVSQKQKLAFKAKTVLHQNLAWQATPNSVLFLLSFEEQFTFCPISSWGYVALQVLRCLPSTILMFGAFIPSHA